MNSMSCYVFRKIRPGVYRDSEAVSLPTISTGLAFSDQNRTETESKGSSLGPGTMMSLDEDDVKAAELR